MSWLYLMNHPSERNLRLVDANFVPDEMDVVELSGPIENPAIKIDSRIPRQLKPRPSRSTYVRRRIKAAGLVLSLALGGYAAGQRVKSALESNSPKCIAVGEGIKESNETIFQFQQRILREKGIDPQQRNFEQQAEDAKCTNNNNDALKEMDITKKPIAGTKTTVFIAE